MSFMRLLAILPILAVVLVAGCVGQVAEPAGTAGEETTAPTQPSESMPSETTAAAGEQLPPNTYPVGAIGAGEADFILVTPQPGQTVFNSDIKAVMAPISFTLRTATGTPTEGFGHFHLYLDDLAEVRTADTSYTWEDQPLGTHTLRVEVHNDAHEHFNPPIVKEVTFETAP